MITKLKPASKLLGITLLTVLIGIAVLIGGQMLFSNPNNPITVLTIGTVDAAGTPDYTCNGTNDNVEFQAALDALPAEGGKIAILAGDYSFGATVSRTIDDVSIEGIGYGTRITYNNSTAVFSAGSQDGWVFRDIETDNGGVNVGSATNWVIQNVLVGSTHYTMYTSSGYAAFDTTACTDLEGTALSITAGTLNWTMPIDTVDASHLADDDWGDISISSGVATLDTGVVGDNEIDYSTVTLDDFDYQTAWRLFYSDGSGDVTELALGASGTYLKSQGASSIPTWDTPAGGSGDITDVGDASTGAAFTADGTGTTLYFEGATPDAYEVILTSADPSGADFTVTLPATTGTVITTGDTGTVTNTMLAGSIDISDKTNLACGAHCTLSGDSIEIDDDFLINTGDTATGNFDFTGAVLQGTLALVFEGSVSDEFETTFSITNPTADRTITFPDATGEVSLLGQSISDAEVDDDITINTTSKTITVSGTGDLVLNDKLEAGDIAANAIGSSEAYIVTDNTAGAINLHDFLTGTPTSGYIPKWNGTNWTWAADSGAGGTGDIDAVGDVSSGDAFIQGGTAGTALWFYDAQGQGKLTIADLTAAHTYTLPDTTGTIITSGDSGTVTSGMCDSAITLDSEWDSWSEHPALTSAYILVGNASNQAAAVPMSGDVFISNTGATTIQANSVALTTDTTGNYVDNVTGGSGIAVTGSPDEGWEPQVDLSALTANWNQTGAYDIVLANASSELHIMESSGATYYGIFDVTDLNASRTYTFPDVSGNIVTTGDTGTVTNTMLAGSIDISDKTNLAAGTNCTLSGDTINVDDAFLLNTGDSGSGDYDFTSAIFMGASPMLFEGATDDDYQIIFAITDPTGSDKTITFPNISGTVVTTGDTGSVTNTMLAGSIDISDKTNLTAGDHITLTDDDLDIDDDFLLNTGDAGTGNYDFTGAIFLGATPLVLEGATDDAYQLNLAVTDITGSSKTITFPNITGTLITTGDTGTVTNTMLAGSIDISDKTNLACGAHCTLSGDSVEIDDDFLLNTGDTGTGDYNFTGAIFMGATPIVFEGATDDSYQLNIAITDITGSSKTITFPNITGTLITTGDTGTVTNAMLAGSIDISDKTNLSGGTNCTLNGDAIDVDDVFLLNSGDTGTGDYNLTGAILMGATPLVLEGATDDSYQLNIAVVDITSSSKTATFQNVTGYVVIDATACSDLEGDGLSITAGVLNVSTATSVTLGIASFDSGDFDVAVGAVTLKNTDYYVILTAAGATVDGASPPDQTSTGTNHTYYTCQFDDSTDEIVYWDFVVPDSYTGGNITPEIYWTATATSGDVVWSVQVLGVTDSEAWDASLGAAQSQTTTTDGTAGDVNTSTVSAFSPSWAAGDLVIVKIFRDADNGSDTMSGDANFIQMKITWPSTR